MIPSTQGKPPGKRPWWVPAASLRNSRNMALWYTAIFALNGSIVIASPPPNPWFVVVCLLWGMLAAWAWLGLHYFARKGEQGRPAGRR
ncbi:hypothetical protein ABIC47_003281 [Leifsonia sp. 563]|nr:hypothetical protein AXZ95_3770 [Leifsonia sp. 115AMFTsu3.1]